MKDKILLLIIGVLIGAIISTGAFLVYIKSSSNECSNQGMGGNPPSMNGQNMDPPDNKFENNNN